MFKCTTQSYDVLYSRWLANPGSLLDLATYDPDVDRLLDLCGGTGAVSREAIGRGAVHDPILVDLNPRCRDIRVMSLHGDAHDPRAYDGIGPVDVAVIRQSLGYLNLKRAFSNVYDVLSAGGRLVFNTFLKPRWKVDFYRHAGKPYLETAAHAFGNVLHVQASPLVGFDVSLFKHHRVESILEALNPFNDVCVFSTGRSIRILAKKSH